jgi:flagellar M-ring protein FliF
LSGFGDTLKNLGPARLAILGATFLGLIVFFIFVSAKVSQPSMSVLYSDLTTADSGDISAKLQESNIAYTVSPDGARVFVPKTDIGRARMLLAEAGLPNGGSLGYEIFDKQTGFGTTSFVQNINQVRALEGELAKTISTLDQVQFARISIVLPQRELFSRDSQEASASVTLKLKGAARLNRQQIYGIQNIVANSIPGLNSNNVSIMDTEANLLARGGGEDDGSMLGLKAEEMQRSYEKRLTASVEDLVSRIVGLNKVRAVITADLDFDRISTNDEIYDPAGQVVRSSQTITEDNVEREASGDLGTTVENNLPGLGAENGGAGSQAVNQNNRAEEITNYEINKTIRNTVRESGEVQKISVAVLVDGRYTTNEEGESVYEPRSDAELKQIEALVKSAVGYDEDRGDTLEVVNMPFAPVDDFAEIINDQLLGFDKSEIMEMVQMVLLVIMGILVLLLVIRPLLSALLESQKRSFEAAKQEAALLASQTTPTALIGGPEGAIGEPGSGGASHGGEHIGQEDESLIDMSQVEGRVKANSVKKVGDIVNNHPNETVSVIRNWMTQD